MKSFLVKVDDDTMGADELKAIIHDGLGVSSSFPMGITVEDTVVYITDPGHKSDYTLKLDKVIEDEVNHPPKDIMR